MICRYSGYRARTQDKSLLCCSNSFRRSGSGHFSHDWRLHLPLIKVWLICPSLEQFVSHRAGCHDDVTHSKIESFHIYATQAGRCRSHLVCKAGLKAGTALEEAAVSRPDVSSNGSNGHTGSSGTSRSSEAETRPLTGAAAKTKNSRRQKRPDGSAAAAAQTAGVSGTAMVEAVPESLSGSADTSRAAGSQHPHEHLPEAPEANLAEERLRSNNSASTSTDSCLNESSGTLSR